MGCCHWLSACFCGMVLRAKRVGHMPVLWTQKLKVGPGLESQPHRTPPRPSIPTPPLNRTNRTQDGRTDIVCIVGPFWPCLMFVTYPLIIGVSLGTAVYMLPGVHWLIQIVWAICTVRSRVREITWEWERSGIGLHMLPTCYQHSHPRIHTHPHAQRRPPCWWP